MATDAQRIPVGDIPSIRPSTEEALLTANSPSHATAPNAVVFKGSDNIQRLLTSQLLQADGSAFPVALRPPTGEVYVFFDTNINAVSTVDDAGTVTPIGAGNYEIKGDIDCSLDPLYPAASQGDAYRVSVAGKIGGGAGPDVQVGDIIVAWADNAGGTQAAVGADWSIEQGNLLAASNAEAIAGTDTLKYIVSSSLAAALQQSKAMFALQAGADINAVVAATTPALTTLITGMRILLRKTAAVNNGAVTLDVGTGVVNVVKTAKDGTEIALVADDLPPGDYLLTYNTTGGARWIIENPKLPDIDITGNAATATLAVNATGQKPQYGSYGGSAVGVKSQSYQSDTTPGSANNPAVAGGAGAFSVVVPHLVGASQQVIAAYPAGATATVPTIAHSLAFDSGTGTISGIASIWNAGTGLWGACADGTRVQVEFWGVTP